MNIRPSAAIRQNYNEIADLCRDCLLYTSDAADE